MGLKRRTSQQGFSLIELMIASVVVVVLVMGYASFQKGSLKNSGQAQITANLENLRANYQGLLNDSEAFYNTVKQNSSPAIVSGRMDCVWSMLCDINQEGSCPPISKCLISPPASPFNLFSLYAAESNRTGNGVVFDSANPSAGLTLQATPCTSYDGPNGVGACPQGDGCQGNDACPFRFEFIWHAECPDDGSHTCDKPTIFTTGRLLAKFRGDSQLGQYYSNLNTLNQFQRGFAENRVSLVLPDNPRVGVSSNVASTLNFSSLPVSSLSALPASPSLVVFQRAGRGAGNRTKGLHVAYTMNPSGDGTHGYVTSGATPTIFLPLAPNGAPLPTNSITLIPCPGDGSQPINAIPPTGFGIIDTDSSGATLQCTSLYPGAFSQVTVQVIDGSDYAATPNTQAINNSNTSSFW